MLKKFLLPWEAQNYHRNDKDWQTDSRNQHKAKVDSPKDDEPVDHVNFELIHF